MLTVRTELRPLLGFLAVALLVLISGAFADGVMEGDTAAFDNLAFALLRHPGAPAWLTEMARDITALGSFAVLGIVLAVAAGGLFLAGKQHAGWLTLAAVLGGTALSTVLKLAFDRPRPQWPGAPAVFTASFPSGHAMLTAVTFLTLGVLLARMTERRRMKVFALGCAILLTVLVGLTRIHLGVHYASDVLAGWCTGAAWALLCWSAALWLQERGRIEPPAL